MAEPWIRVHAGLIDKPIVGRVVDSLNVSFQEAIGLMVCFWSGVSKSARRGDVSSVPDSVIERWAGWPIRRGQKKGAFAGFVRTHHIDADGRVREWDAYAGRLDDRRERTESPDGKSTYVYYAVDGDECKIGWSGNPWARVGEMRTARPRIQLIATERGDRDLEMARHAQFAGACIAREWFTLTVELRNHIRSLAAVVVTPTTNVATNPTTEQLRRYSVASRANEDETLRDERTSSSSSARDALRSSLTSETGRQSLDQVLNRASHAESCAVALRSMQTGNDPATPQVAGDAFEAALTDFAANGDRWNAALFRRYLERAAKPKPPPTGNGAYAGTASSGDFGADLDRAARELEAKEKQETAEREAREKSHA